MSQRMRLKILLLDEDQVYAERLRHKAAAAGIEVHWRRSLFELGSVGRLGDYDALIVEPLIGPVNGLEIAQYADTFFPRLPVLLLANQDLPLPLPKWPASVTRAISKDTPLTPSYS